jgi:hypothetical protein
MKYMLLIYGDETQMENVTPEQSQQVMNDYWAYEEELQKRGGRLAGEALQPTSTATTVRNVDGQVLTTDGPFAETKEQLGGFYFLEAKDLDEAIELAGLCPGSRHGSVEVRPIMEFEAP